MTSGTRAIKKAIEKIEERTPFLRDPKKVQSKIEAYRVIGFKNPEKMMRKFPPMLGLDIEWNVKPKIEAHRALGFKNPEKMIGNSPQQ
jgi:hypothetical protein